MKQKMQNNNGKGKPVHSFDVHTENLGDDDLLNGLVFVVGGINFLWATPTPTKMEPEELLRDFLNVTGLKIGKGFARSMSDAS
mmetsp:Transcript_24318/g.49270  ORF Transcript_24318/g.49270 Transcript_24318/m.49270 type:complete len:83 (+) Transcript_24318:842-1090(+)